MQVLNQLAAGAGALNIGLSDLQLEQLSSLLAELLKWNNAYNLTAIKSADDAIKLHLLDSLAVVPHWRHQLTLDVGTGAGFPGLPLAIALPDREFHLLDGNSKKIRFIQQVCHQLKINNVTAWHRRVEDHQGFQYDAIVSRAFASLADMVSLSEHLLAADGRWMAMKGRFSAEEAEELPAWAKVIEQTDLQVPGLSAQRCLIELARGKH